MQTQKNYKNVGTHILIPNNSGEPLNTTLSDNTELSSSCNLEGCETLLEKAEISRVPVISKSNKPLMPCKPAKARKLQRDGKAVGKWSKLGSFYIQLTFDPKSELNKDQKVIVGIDPGSKFDGYSVSSKTVNLTGMSELPSGIADKLESRRTMRRARRFRNTRRRKYRFDNRNKEGFVVEDVRFNHYEKKLGKHFSTVEIGKALLYKELRTIGKVTLIDGTETSKRRKELGLKKDSRKNKREPESHATDEIALASLAKDLESITMYPFYVWKRYQNSRRQLHRFEPDKGGDRKRYGGSQSLSGLKKNDIVVYQNELARVGGYMGNRISLHDFDLDNKRFTQSSEENEFPLPLHPDIL